VAHDPEPISAVARGVAKRAAGTGVTVNAVLPGPTLSEGVEAMLKDAAGRACQSIEEAAAAFVKGHDRPRSSDAPRPPRRSSIWWSTSPRPRHRPRPALRSGSTAA